MHHTVFHLFKYKCRRDKDSCPIAKTASSGLIHAWKSISSFWKKEMHNTGTRKDFRYSFILVYYWPLDKTRANQFYTELMVALVFNHNELEIKRLFNKNRCFANAVQIHSLSHRRRWSDNPSPSWSLCPPPVKHFTHLQSTVCSYFNRSCIIFLF